MPKSNLVRPSPNKRDVAFNLAITEGLLMNGMSKRDLIKKSGIAPSTVYNDLKHPDRMTVGRARRYFDVLQLPSEKRGAYL